MAIDNPHNMMPPLLPEEYASLMEAVQAYGARLPIFQDEVGKRLRIQIDLLHRVLHPQQVEGNLPALTLAWPANEKSHYRRRCADLMGALEALHEALAAEIEDEDRDVVGAMASAHDEFTNLEAPTL